MLCINCSCKNVFLSVGPKEFWQNLRLKRSTPLSIRTALFFLEINRLFHQLDWEVSQRNRPEHDPRQTDTARQRHRERREDRRMFLRSQYRIIILSSLIRRVIYSIVSVHPSIIHCNRTRQATKHRGRDEERGRANESGSERWTSVGLLFGLAFLSLVDAEVK